MENKLCPAQDSPPEGRVMALPCHKLVEHPLPLAFYSQTHLAGLTASIKENGLLEPILVQPLEDRCSRVLNGHPASRIELPKHLLYNTLISIPYNGRIY